MIATTANGPPGPDRHAGMSLDAVTHELRLRRPWTIARGTSESRANVFVRISAEGTTGFGESAPIRRYGEDAASVRAVIEQFRAALEAGGTPALGSLGETAFAHLESIASGGGGPCAAARAGIEMAVLDWLARLAGVPLGAQLGVPPGPMPRTSFSIGIDEPATVADKVREAGPHPILKIKLGTGSPAGDRAIIEAVRSVTDKPIRVDANEGWSGPGEAIEMIEWLAERNVELVEQPLPAGRWRETAEVRRRSPLPLVADEDAHGNDEFGRLAASYDGINIKLMKCGGLRSAVAMAQAARAAGLRVMLGCMIESSLAITAAAHLGPLTDWLDLDGHLLVADDPFTGVRVVDGEIALPPGPGIGAVPLDETRLFAAAGRS